MDSRSKISSIRKWVLYGSSVISDTETFKLSLWCIDKLGVFHANRHLCVLIHIWTKGEVGAPLNRFKPSSKICLLTGPRLCFFCASFINVISVLFCYAFMHVYVLMPWGHLLGKGWPLGSRLWCLIVTLSLSHWYPGSGFKKCRHNYP